MATTSNPADDDEWELVNDDGFVYKRNKRPRVDSTSNFTSSAPPQPPDPAAEEKMRRERKKRALVKLKEKYQKEIDQWELLSNTLKAMQQQNTLATHTQQQLHTTSFDQPLGGSALPSAAESLEGSTTHRRLVDDLISQAEAQEAIINKVSHLCDMAEALCDAQEERLNKSYIDLPIWASSPRELVASLCED